MRSLDGERSSVLKPRFELVPFNALQPSGERSYLIKGLVPREGLTIVWGPPKSGKSFWTFDLAMHVALGWEYRGRRVMQGSVIYCAFEGAEGYKARAEAFRLKRLPEEISEVPFYLIAAPVDLVTDHIELIGAIRVSLGGSAPVAVVLDTLNRSLRGSESSDEDMGGYVKAADTIRESFRCAVIVVHHCGIDDKRPRGHTSLTGAADAQLAVKRDGANFSVTVEWLKDGPEGAVITSRLESVEIAIDPDGDPVTSCVVQSADGDETTSAPTSRRLSDRQKMGLNALNALLATAGEPLPSVFDLPLGIMSVKVTEWRDELFSRGVLDKSAKNPRADFLRLKYSLGARHLIAEREGLVWPMKPKPAP